MPLKEKLDKTQKLLLFCTKNAESTTTNCDPEEQKFQSKWPWLTYEGDAMYCNGQCLKQLYSVTVHFELA